MKNRTIRNVGMELGMMAYRKGMPCAPKTDDFYSSKIRYLDSDLAKNFTLGWIEGWRTEDLDSNGGW